VFSFKILKKSQKSKARLGLIKTPHGVIHTPAFLPVATQGSVKTLCFQDIEKIGFEALLANTYHLYLRPGSKIIKKLGGLHKFMNWSGPLITDSGGFQVFSLGAGREQKVGKVLSEAEKQKSRISLESDLKRGRLVKITEKGVYFQSHLDGSLHFFTPQKSIKIQEELGADIIFAFDECTSPLHSYEYTQKAMERTHRWAEESLLAHQRKDQALFGIVQGGPFADLRKKSAQFIGQLPFAGFGIGGSFGQEEMKKTLSWTIPYLPKSKPIHLLGIGYRKDILTAVKQGVDLFDCVQPTRLARHGIFLTKKDQIDILKPIYQEDKKPIQKNCSCFVCQNFSRAYLHHLFKTKEMLGYRLATYHNLWLMKKFMEEIKEKIRKGEI